MLKASPLIAACLLAATSAPAFAAPANAVARAVSFADLDLSRAAGRARLDQRIQAAVRAVCGTAAPTDLRGRAEVRLCRSETLNRVAADRRTGEVYVAQLAPASEGAAQAH